jgi:cell wall-associated NlpC family hydrolase
MSTPMPLKDRMMPPALRAGIMSIRLSGSVIALMLAVFLPGCGGYAPTRPSPAQLPLEKRLQRMGYTIQAGAFAVVENAARLADILSGQGLDAIYFKAEDGLFKVRFGDFTSREHARKTAERLKTSGIIEAFYIVSPSEYAVDRQVRLGNDYLRNELVKTSMQFIDLPYLMGGTSAETGFDCSGLTLTVYQLNGLNLPRNSQKQFDVGYAVHRDDLLKGDLLFFSDNKWGKVSHVGIYAGDDKFVHAPGKGKKIRMDSLSARYYKQRYVGARSYL